MSHLRRYFNPARGVREKNGIFFVSPDLFAARGDESGLSFTQTDPPWSPDGIRDYCREIHPKPDKPGALEIVAPSWPACGLAPPHPAPVPGPYGDLHCETGLFDATERETLSGDCERRLETGEARFVKTFRD